MRPGTAAGAGAGRMMPLSRVPAAVDTWLFAPGSPLRLDLVRRLLAAAIGMRLAFWGYADLSGQPPSLFLPRGVIGVLFDRMPSAEAIVALQVGGIAASFVVAGGRARRWGLPVAWICLLVLGGLRGSLGKILHNDVLLLLAAVPLLAAPAERRPAEHRAGWPVRAALVVVATSYLLTGVAKLVHSGISWVTSDNMRWIMAEAARDPRGHVEGVARLVADHAALAHAMAAGILLLELVFPIVLFRPRLAPLLLAGAAAFHAGTWLTVGLDYWAHLAVVAIVLVEWDRLALPRVKWARQPA